MDDESAYRTGYKVAWAEIQSRHASFTMAKARGLYPDSQDHRIDWDQGYEACVCAYRLGHDVQGMIDLELFSESTFTAAAVVLSLLDGTWDREPRPEPRREQQ